MFSLSSSPTVAAGVFVFQIYGVETKFLLANSITEFSPRLGPERHILRRNLMSAFRGIAFSALETSPQKI